MEVDMSDKAITGRLRRVEQLRRLCLSLAQAKLIAPGLGAASVPVEQQLNQKDTLINRGKKS